MADVNAEEPLLPRVQIGRYSKLAQARETALVLAAKDIPYWIERSGRDWEILVEIDLAKIAREELDAVEEEAMQRAGDLAAKLGRPKTLPLFIAGWFLGGFFFAQQMLGPIWAARGAAVSSRILSGEWWRAVTALTLHGDLPHLVANLLTGLLFAAFLQPILGTGLSWFLVVLSGFGGNLLNAWSYGSAEHASIGASTAVFGALGILVGIELAARWQTPHSRNRWSLIVPIGAGLALLAFLGVGDRTERVDVLAHLWGLLCGFPLGLIAETTRLECRISKAGQILLSLLACGLPLFCWIMAMRD